MAVFLGERITNNARKILVVRPQGIEPRIAGYKPGATNHITLGAYIHVKHYSRAGLFNVTPQLAFEFEYLQDIHLRM